MRSSFCFLGNQIHRIQYGSPVELMLKLPSMFHGILWHYSFIILPQSWSVYFQRVMIWVIVICQVFQSKHWPSDSENTHVAVTPPQIWAHKPAHNHNMSIINLQITTACVLKPQYWYLLSHLFNVLNGILGQMTQFDDYDSNHDSLNEDPPRSAAAICIICCRHITHRVFCSFMVLYVGHSFMYWNVNHYCRNLLGSGGWELGIG